MAGLGSIKVEFSDLSEFKDLVERFEQGVSLLVVAGLVVKLGLEVGVYESAPGWRGWIAKPSEDGDMPVWIVFIDSDGEPNLYVRETDQQGTRLVAQGRTPAVEPPIPNG